MILVKVQNGFWKNILGFLGVYQQWKLSMWLQEHCCESEWYHGKKNSKTKFYMFIFRIKVYM